MSLSKTANPNCSTVISEQVLNLIIHGLSGSLAGCISTFLLYPSDNIKMRLQAISKKDREALGVTSQTEITPEMVKPHSISEIVKDILEKDGLLGFYKGLGPSLAGTLTNFGVYFFWYEFFKGYFIHKQFSLVGYSLTAGCAGLITSTCTNPFGVAHTRALLEPEKSPHLLKIFKNIIKEEGIGGLFKGLGVSYILVINPIVQFVAYEFLKKKFKSSKDNAAVLFLVGALSKALATSVTYPYSTVKVNMHASKNKNITQLQMISKILERKGLKGFYHGFGTKMVQTVINSALMLVIYERIQVIIKKMVLKILAKV